MSRVNQSKAEIQGNVISVLDGNSFLLELGGKSAHELKLLRQLVTVTIANSTHPGTHTLGGMIAKMELEKRLAGQRIRCEIDHHDPGKGFIAILDQIKSEWSFAIYA